MDAKVSINPFCILNPTNLMTTVMQNFSQIQALKDIKEVVFNFMGFVGISIFLWRTFRPKSTTFFLFFTPPINIFWYSRYKVDLGTRFLTACEKADTCTVLDCLYLGVDINFRFVRLNIDGASLNIRIRIRPPRVEISTTIIKGNFYFNWLRKTLPWWNEF